MANERTTLDKFDDARRKINLAKLALDTVLEDQEGHISYDMAASILMLIKEAGEEMQGLRLPIDAMAA